MLRAYYEKRDREESEGRGHLGASVLGRECDREVWYSFRWANGDRFDGQQLQLFERGHRSEAWLVEDLRGAGFTVLDVDPATGKQWRVKWGHLGGSCDGKILGIPENPLVWHLLEVKTCGLNAFDKLVAGGVRRTKGEHYVQMQVYMHGLDLPAALYVSISKNDDRVYTEIVPYNQSDAEIYLARGKAISLMDTAPARKSMDTAHPPCSWCDHRELCHGEQVPVRNCRTCIESSALDDGTWHCNLHDKILSWREQGAACGSYLLSPELFHASVLSVDEQHRRITYQTASGRIVEGGSP